MSVFKRPKIEIPSYQAPPTPPTPTVYQYPWGIQYQKEIPGKGLAWVFEESPEVKAAREKREAMRTKILGTLGTISPEREAQLDEFAKTYQSELLKYAQPHLEQSLIGRGLGGSSIYKEAVADLVKQAGKEAVLQKEALKKSDEATKLATLQALESGLSAEAAKQLQLGGLASTDLARQQALQQAYWNALLRRNLAQAQLAQQYRSGLFGSGSQLLSAIMMAAMLGA